MRKIGARTLKHHEKSDSGFPVIITKLTDIITHKKHLISSELKKTSLKLMSSLNSYNLLFSDASKKADRCAMEIHLTVPDLYFGYKLALNTSITMSDVHGHLQSTVVSQATKKIQPNNLRRLPKQHVDATANKANEENLTFELINNKHTSMDLLDTRYLISGLSIEYL